MKKLLTISVLALLSACGGKDSDTTGQGNILENLSYSVDTVVVNAGEEIINLSMGLYYSDVSADSKFLYQFTPSDNSLTVVDLDHLTIAKKITFEKEGPNGIGSSVSEVKVLPQEKFMFSGYESAGIFDAEAVKLEDISLKANEFPALGGMEGSDLNYQIRSSADGQFLYSLPGGMIEFDRDFAVVNRSGNFAKIIDIPAMDNTEKFSMFFFSDGRVYLNPQNYYLDEHLGVLYLSSSVSSDLYRYDFQKGSLELFSFPITVSPKEKTEAPRMEVSSKEEFEKESQKVNSQISFKHLMWDETRELFFRLGSITRPSGSPDVSAKVSIYLYAIDLNMKLVGETLVNDLSHTPEYPFFKDGKLYSYVNVEDELGFAVFTFDF